MNFVHLLRAPLDIRAFDIEVGLSSPPLLPSKQIKQGLRLQQQGTLLGAQLVQALDLELHDAQHGVFMFAVDDAPVPVPALLLLRVHHGTGLEAHDAEAQLKQPLVQVVGLSGALGVVGLRVAHARLERVVSGADDARPVQAQDIPREDALHVEGEADEVALGQEVGEAVDVCGDVVWFLAVQFGEKLLQGLGEDEWAGKIWRGWLGADGCALGGLANVAGR